MLPAIKGTEYVGNKKKKKFLLLWYFQSERQEFCYIKTDSEGMFFLTVFILFFPVLLMNN